MPISSFSTGLQRALSFLPGTYGTCLIRNHALAGAFREMEEIGHFPPDVMDSIRKSIDCDLFFFDHAVKLPVMYGILVGSTLLLIGIYILLNVPGRAKK